MSNYPLPWRIQEHDGYMPDDSAPIEIVAANGRVVACNTAYYPKAISQEAAGMIVSAVNATTITPAEVGGLVERLRDRAESYRMGGTSSEHTAAILDEAATSLTTERAAHAETKRAMDEARAVHRWSVDDVGNGILYVCRNEHDKGDACEWEPFVPLRRAEAAEAQRDEALKALEEIGNGCDGRIDKDALPCRVARRAIGRKA